MVKDSDVAAGRFLLLDFFFLTFISALRQALVRNHSPANLLHPCRALRIFLTGTGFFLTGTGFFLTGTGLLSRGETEHQDKNKHPSFSDWNRLTLPC